MNGNDFFLQSQMRERVAELRADAAAAAAGAGFVRVRTALGRWLTTLGTRLCEGARAAELERRIAMVERTPCTGCSVDL
ncbi:hypothetical protein [Salinispira pacifica]